MPDILEILLLLALPASGKSEVRRYLSRLSPEQCTSEFHLGPTVQLDDFPYVHMMRRIADELTAREHDGVFFNSPFLPFKEPRDWGTLIELVNEDYADLVAQRRQTPPSPAEWLFDRLDAARVKVGADPALGKLPAALRREVASAVDAEAADLLQNKNAEIPESLAGKTIVMEFARGGADGSTLPLPHPYGYRYALDCLSDDILGKSAILYIWVTPEESRRKNRERCDPNDPGSILHHSVPLAVMYGDYGCDDIEWLLETSNRPGCIEVRKGDGTFHLPLARFDNRVDKTSFIRNDPSDWKPEEIAAIHEGLKSAFDHLSKATR